MTRRDFIAAALALPFWPQTSAARFIAAVRLGSPAGAPTAPLGRLLGNGLDARLFNDLSLIQPDDPKTLVTSNDRFYVRTASPSQVAGTQGFSRTLEDRESTHVGPWVMECAGNADPANFGLLSAAEWDGVPAPALLERLPKPAAGARVLVTGVDDAGPAVTSVPGASWIFSRDQLARAIFATRMNGAPLPRHHGSPSRLVVPGWYGCACIKWVDSIAFVADDARATSQMQEFATRTHQRFDSPEQLRSLRARDYEPPVIDTAAIPVRVEKWVVSGRLEYRIVGIIWGGSKPTNALSIRFKAGGPWTTVEDCAMPVSTLTWSTWTHRWRPTEIGRYQIVLRVDDPTIRTRRLDLFYYVRDVEIDEI